MVPRHPRACRVTSRTVAIVQARMTSTRLPGKVAMPLAGVPLLLHVVDRAARIPGVDAVCVAVPDGPEHKAIPDILAARPEVVVAYGPEHDVLRRYAIAAERTGAETVIRITSDCPMIDPVVSGALLSLYRTTGHRLARTAPERGYPWGYDTEVFAVELLRTADREATEAYDREHVTPYLWARPERFPAVFIDRSPDRRSWHVTVDTPADYAYVSALFDRLYGEDPFFGIAALERLYAEEPHYLVSRSE